jgi:hypothetical protein
MRCVSYCAPASFSLRVSCISFPPFLSTPSFFPSLYLSRFLIHCLLPPVRSWPLSSPCTHVPPSLVWQGPGAYDLSRLSLKSTASSKVPQAHGTSSFLDVSMRSSLVKPPVEGQPRDTGGNEQVLVHPVCFCVPCCAYLCACRGMCVCVCLRIHACACVCICATVPVFVVSSIVWNAMHYRILCVSDAICIPRSFPIHTNVCNYL